MDYANETQEFLAQCPVSPLVAERFVVAREGRVAQALESYRNYTAWSVAAMKRNELPEEEDDTTTITTIERQDVAERLQNGRCYATGVHTKNDGAAVVLFVSRLHTPAELVSRDLLALTYVVEQALQDPKTQQRRVAIVFDLFDFGFLNSDSALFSDFFVFLRDVYPAQLSQIFFVNYSWFASTWLAMTTPFYFGEMRDKMIYLPAANMLGDYMDWKEISPMLDPQYPHPRWFETHHSQIPRTIADSKPSTTKASTATTASAAAAEKKELKTSSSATSVKETAAAAPKKLVIPSAFAGSSTTTTATTTTASVSVRKVPLDQEKPVAAIVEKKQEAPSKDLATAPLEKELEKSLRISPEKAAPAPEKTVPAPEKIAPAPEKAALAPEKTVAAAPPKAVSFPKAAPASDAPAAIVAPAASDAPAAAPAIHKDDTTLSSSSFPSVSDLGNVTNGHKTLHSLTKSRPTLRHRPPKRMRPSVTDVFGNDDDNAADEDDGDDDAMAVDPKPEDRPKPTVVSPPKLFGNFDPGQVKLRSKK